MKTYFNILVLIAAAANLLAIEKVAFGGRIYYTNGQAVLGITDQTEVNENDIFALSDFYGATPGNIQPNSELVHFVQAQTTKRKTDSVGPLLGDINFNQGAPYNDSCPRAPTMSYVRCPAGCVAIAMAQILTYWRKPQKPCHGTGEYRWEVGNQTLRETFEGWTPDWSNILPNYEDTTITATDAQKSAVATLCKKLGYSVQMNYNRDESGAFSERVAGALRDYFNYNCQDQSSKIGDAVWNRQLTDNLRAGHPVFYSSIDANNGGHAYVCDGFFTYEGEEAYPYYHFNWGWGGKSNGWFRLNLLEITDGGSEFSGSNLNFTASQRAIFDIIPDDITAISQTNTDNPQYIYFDILGHRIDNPHSTTGIVIAVDSTTGKAIKKLYIK